MYTSAPKYFNLKMFCKSERSEELSR
uniref:Uncharacterized protein n=1 Tax=Anguilla anguilla TaxID=7936 RepID=A0A0E9RFX5_ANGAN